MQVTSVGHAGFHIQTDAGSILCDPWVNPAYFTSWFPFPDNTQLDWDALGECDYLYVSHLHKDHFDPKALGHIVTDKTLVVLTETCGRQYQEGLVMHNGDLKTIQGITVEAVPAYNIVHLRPSGFPYHAKSFGNGYVFTFGEKRVYVAGDTENIPEMKDLKNIDIAFLPMNLPYTMSPEMVADAAKAMQPKIVYPYHFGDTDTADLERLLADTGIEVRVRSLA